MARTKGARGLSAELVLKRDFLKTYKRLGPAWLEEQARAAPLEFLKAFITVTKQQPAPAKPTEPEPPPAGELSAFEAARHVAFVLNRALYENGEPLVVEGEVLVEPEPSWMPPADQEQPVEQPQGAVEDQPALPAPEPTPEAKPERRSLADLLGVEPPVAVEPSLYGAQEHPAQQPEEAEAVEQPALPAPEPEDRPARRDLADLLGIEPSPAVVPSLYGGGIGQYRSGDPAEQGTQRRDVHVVQRESVADKLKRYRG